MTLADHSVSSSGLLLWAAMVDLLAEDFLSEEADLVMQKKDKIRAFAWVMLGGEFSHVWRLRNSQLTRV